MYPNLTLPLLTIVGVAFLVLAVLTVRRPVLRRLALRQVARRRTEAALVIGGSMLGTAIIVGALVVGDTLGFSVRQSAYRTLGPIDERLVTTSALTGDQVGRAVTDGLAGSNLVDGVLTARYEQGAATRLVKGERIAEPRVFVWDVDFNDASYFGAAGGPSGLTGRSPRDGEVVVNTSLARAMHLGVGSSLVVYIGGAPHELSVIRVLADRGLAGTGPSGERNRNAFVEPGFLRVATPQTQSVTWVSNRGGVQSGNKLTAEVTQRIHALLGPLAGQTVVETPKKDVLSAAQKTGDSLGALFLMIGSFSIIAGALLLVNIFVMLADERKGQLGMLRAAGLKRSHVVGAFTIEGAVYALVATLIGTGIGIGVGRGVAYLAARIFSAWSQDGEGLDVKFAVTGTSLVNGAALGLVISLAAILITSARISRFNIIAAIRDLETPPSVRSRRRRNRLAVAGFVIFTALSVPAVAGSQAVGTFLFPSLAALCLVPLLSQRFGKRIANTSVSAGILAWGLLANVVRPDVYDSSSMTVYVVVGTLLAVSAVALVSENQTLLLRPVRRFIERPSEGALAGRLALAYPLAKRFRTGATLIMYSLIFLVLVLLMEIGGVLEKSIDSQIVSSTGGYALRVDFNPQQLTGDVAGRIKAAAPGDITDVAPLLSARGNAADPGHRTSEAIQTLAVGVPPETMTRVQFDKRLRGLTSDGAVWRALQDHPDYVVLDPFFGATGGPNGDFYSPGDTFTLTDPATGRTVKRTIAGILKQSTVFYSPLNPMAFPAVMSESTLRDQFRSTAIVSSALVGVRPGSNPDQVAPRLQGTMLAQSLVATALPSTIRRMFNANVSFFRLMQGFLALGLLVGICGLGVVMVRAVRERRRTIGILRALGFRARTVERSFLLESGFIALEGVVLGSVLGILTTWLMYQKSAAFGGIHSGFPVMWGSAAVLALITVAASLLATFGPARRAARIVPALATRVSD